MGKIKFLCIGLALFLISGTSHAFNDPDYNRQNAISLKFGYCWYAESGIPMDYWMVDRDDFNDWVWELSYERRFWSHFKIETSIGRFGESTVYKNFITDSDSANIELHNNYLSLTATYALPIGERQEMYIGAGPDYYRTQTEFHYFTGARSSYDVNESFNSFGGHALIGYEYLVFPTPSQKKLYDMPVAVFCEYKYTQVTVKEADKRFVDNYNAATGASLSYKDKGVGNHMVLTGLKWYF